MTKNVTLYFGGPDGEIEGKHEDAFAIGLKTDQTFAGMETPDFQDFLMTDKWIEMFVQDIRKDGRSHKYRDILKMGLETDD